MSDIGKLPIEPDEDLDDELVRFTDDLLDGRIELDEAETILSENEDLRDLQEMVLRMHRAFGSEDPSPAMASRMKMSLVTELRKMDFQDEAKPDSVLERLRKLLTGGGKRGGLNVLVPIVGIAAVFLFLFVFLLTDLDFKDLLGSSLNNPNGYPIPGQMEAVTQLFGETNRVSVSSSGVEVDQDSWYSAISADGRFVAFESQADNLAGGDGNGARDVFVRDRLLGTTELISAVNGQSAFGDSRYPALSADGRYVTFYSFATNLAQNDDNGVGDVFLFDRQNGTMTAVSLTPGGQVGDRESRNPAISGDGQVVAFESLATDLVANDNNNASDIFVYTQQSGQLERVSLNADGEEGDSHSFNPDLSIDGSFVAFQSRAENLWANDSNGKTDIFVYFRDGSNQVQVERVSVAVEGGQSNGDSGFASISADGRFVTFSSFASNLAGGEIYGNNLDVYLYDRQLNETERISADPLGQEPDGASVNPDISADGRFVSFDSTGTNLVEGDHNDRVDVFVRDRMPPVAVELNYLTGSPGSYFTLSGRNFQADSNVSLVVNGFALGDVLGDGDGNFTAVLATDEADLGRYIVQASAGTLSGAVGFALDANSAVRPQEGQAAVFNIPPGIAYSYFNHLPVAVGN